jgi:ankyrin repeat protein
MRLATVTTILVAVLVWAASCPSIANGDGGLAIRIVPGGTAGSSVIDFNEPLQVVLTNTTDQTIRIWDPGFQIGYDQLSFSWVNLRTGAEYSSRKREGDDFDSREATEDHPGFIEIAPANGFAFNVYFDGVKWYKPSQTELPLWVGLPGPNSADLFTISAVFESKAAAPDSGLPVWTGKITSEPIPATFVADRIRTPHDYLWNGFPERALEIMQADPTWIARRDEYSYTPLHIAAQFGYAEIVEWLLNNGADVNGRTSDGSTPLHLSSDPDVVALMLKHDPDLSIRDGFDEWTVLQAAAANLVDARRESEWPNWQTIVDMYLEAGADYDLLTAIHLDDLERVKEILRQSPDIADDFQDQSPLRVAASLGREQICLYLVEEYPVDVDDFGRGVGYPIIIEALAFPDIVKLLIEHGADLQTRINWRGNREEFWIIGDDATALHFAARDGVPKTIDLLIDHGVDIFATSTDIRGNPTEQTALDVAASFGRSDNAIAMLHRPEFAEADKGYRQALLNRCLSIAAPLARPINNAELVELVVTLLEAGADPDTKDHNYEATPMRLAARRIHPESKEENRHLRQIVAILIEHGATLDLFTAVAIGDADAVARLLEQDPASVNTRGPDGYPALHFAVGMNDAESLKLLLEAGADVDIRNTDNGTGYPDETALHCAAFWGREDLAKLLIDAGADVNARTNRQSTPLHSAARMTNVEVARLLLENGALINARDEKGETPLDWCNRLNWRNADEIRKLFREYGQSVDP